MLSVDIPSLIINDGIQSSFHSLYFLSKVDQYIRQTVWRMSQKDFALSGSKHTHRWGTSDLGETRNTDARILLGEPVRLQARNDSQ